MATDACVMCRRTADEIGHGAMLLSRKRPAHPSEYQICLGCAREVRKQEDERAQEAIRQAERSGV